MCSCLTFSWILLLMLCFDDDFFLWDISLLQDFRDCKPIKIWVVGCSFFNKSPILTFKFGKDLLLFLLLIHWVTVSPCFSLHGVSLFSFLNHISLFIQFHSALQALNKRFRSKEYFHLETGVYFKPELSVGQYWPIDMLFPRWFI